ncbi:hypothetical protein [Tissierella sp.]|uniref:hypothetical protein n=1 Tax=Tissierella sp. TaxID=41274 RepID=UPI00286619AE|nr:hypothetical protein [Tissierella sp.]MDR7856287.1 hypothetical protein [Tissierella sp.]
MFKMKKMLIVLCMSIVLLSQFTTTSFAKYNIIPSEDYDDGGATGGTGGTSGGTGGADNGGRPGGKCDEQILP